MNSTVKINFFIVVGIVSLSITSIIQCAGAGPGEPTQFNLAQKLTGLIKPTVVRPNAAMQPTNIGTTIFFSALEKEDVRSMEKFLNAGFSIETPESSPTGGTPFRVAVAQNKLSVAEWLLDKGANINGTDKNGITPLLAVTMANEPNAVATVQWLLERRAHVNAAASGVKLTPLMAASMQGNKQLVACLLKGGADKTLKNNRDLMAIDLTSDPAIKAMLNLDKNLFNNDSVYGATIDRFATGGNDALFDEDSDEENDEVEPLGAGDPAKLRKKDKKKRQKAKKRAEEQARQEKEKNEQERLIRIQEFESEQMDPTSFSSVKNGLKNLRVFAQERQSQEAIAQAEAEENKREQERKEAAALAEKNRLEQLALAQRQREAAEREAQVKKGLVEKNWQKALRIVPIKKGIKKWKKLVGDHRRAILAGIEKLADDCVMQSFDKATSWISRDKLIAQDRFKEEIYSSFVAEIAQEVAQESGQAVVAQSAGLQTPRPPKTWHGRPRRRGGRKQREDLARMNSDIERARLNAEKESKKLELKRNRTMHALMQESLKAQEFAQQSPQRQQEVRQVLVDVRATMGAPAPAAAQHHPPAQAYITPPHSFNSAHGSPVHHYSPQSLPLSPYHQLPVQYGAGASTPMHSVGFTTPAAMAQPAQYSPSHQSPHSGMNGATPVNNIGYDSPAPLVVPDRSHIAGLEGVRVPVAIRQVANPVAVAQPVSDRSQSIGLEGVPNSVVLPQSVNSVVPVAAPQSAQSLALIKPIEQMDNDELLKYKTRIEEQLEARRQIKSNLMTGAITGNLAQVQQALAHKVNPNETNKEGYSALATAISWSQNQLNHSNYHTIAQLLIGAKANVHDKNALDAAARLAVSGDQGFIDLLEEQGVKVSGALVKALKEKEQAEKKANQASDDEPGAGAGAHNNE